MNIKTQNQTDWRRILFIGIVIAIMLSLVLSACAPFVGGEGGGCRGGVPCDRYGFPHRLKILTCERGIRRFLFQERHPEFGLPL